MAKEKEEGTVTNLQTRVDVVATAKHPYAEKGEKFKIHPEVAKQFLKNGFIDKYKGAADEDPEG